MQIDLQLLWEQASSLWYTAVLPYLSVGAWLARRHVASLHGGMNMTSTSGEKFEAVATLFVWPAVAAWRGALVPLWKAVLWAATGEK